MEVGKSRCEFGRRPSDARPTKPRRGRSSLNLINTCLNFQTTEVGHRSGTARDTVMHESGFTLCSAPAATMQVATALSCARLRLRQVGCRGEAPVRRSCRPADGSAVMQRCMNAHPPRLRESLQAFFCKAMSAYSHGTHRLMACCGRPWAQELAKTCERKIGR